MFLVVQLGARPDLLLDILARRRRPVRLVTDTYGTVAGDLRAVAVTGGEAPPDLLAQCVDGGVPLLATGVADAEPRQAALMLTPDAEGDPVFDAYPDGAPCLVDGPPLPDGATVLARDADGGARAVVLGGALLLGFRPEVPAPSLPFVQAQAAALLGRWVDVVVGRTPEEMPWGRRGPQPVHQPPTRAAAGDRVRSGG